MRSVDWRTGCLECMFCVSVWFSFATPALAQSESGPRKTVIQWSFDKDGDFRQWTPNGHVAEPAVRGGRLQGRSAGADPILLGPVFDVPATATQQIEIVMASNRAGEAEIFWTETLQGRFGGFNQQKSMRLPVRGDGQLHTYRVRPFWHKAGHIVRLRFDPPRDAVFEIERLAIVDQLQPVRSSKQAWLFDSGAQGWQVDHGLVEVTVGEHGLAMTTSDGRPSLISPLLEIDAASNPIVSVRMSVSAGTTGSVFCASHERVGWHSVGFPLRADGRMHTYNVDMSTLKTWSDRIIALGLSPTNVPAGRVMVESIEVAGEPRGPAELVVDYFGQAEGVNRVGRPAKIVCQVRNLGGRVAAGVTAELKAPDTVRLTGQARQQVQPVSMYLPKQAVWTVEATQAGKAILEVRLISPDQEPITARAVVDFTSVPKLPSDGRPTSRHIGYVPEPRPVHSNIDVGVFYFPGWPDMGRWQPILDYPMRKPVLGWYDESNPECADWQIKWAVEHGITFFMVDWYWTQGNRQLEHWLHDAYMKARYRKYLKWAIMWANHNRPGTHGVEDWKNVTQYWIDHYLRTDEYYRIDGRPAVFIWAPANIRRDVGGTQQAAQLYAMSQRMARKAGLPGIYFVAMSSHESEANCRQLKEEGYEAFTSYHAFQLAAARAGSRDFSFERVVDTSPEVWRAADGRAAGLRYFPLVDSGWDSRPWHKNKARVIYGRTPELFGRLCREARRYANDTGKKIVTVGPCNEWGEGSYIEPYAQYGFADLDALRTAFCAPGEYPPNLVPADIGRGPYDLPAVTLKHGWDFNTDGDSEGWSLAGRIQAEVRGGLLVGRSTGDDPIIPGPPTRMEASQVKNLVLRMRCDRDDSAQLFWGTHVSAQGEAQSVSIPLIGDGTFHEYRVDLHTNVRWRGVITSLRLDPVGGAGAHFAIDYVRFE